MNPASPLVFLGVFFALFFSPFTAASPADYIPGAILVPANGSAIAPGSMFNFTYNIHTDYCMSSYDFSVWLITEPPSNLRPSDSFMSGFYMGTFSTPNYPGM